MPAFSRETNSVQVSYKAAKDNAQPNTASQTLVDHGTTDQRRSREDDYTNNVRLRKYRLRRKGTNCEQAKHEAGNTHPRTNKTGAEPTS